MNNEWNQLGSKIYSLRKTRKLSQKELSALLGISDKSLSRIERGEAFMNVSVADRLSKVMKVPIGHLVGHLGFQDSTSTDEEELYIQYFRMLNTEEKKSFLTLMKSIVDGNRTVIRKNKE